MTRLHKMRRLAVALSTLVLVTLPMTPGMGEALPQTVAAQLPAGDGSFQFTGWNGPAITVFTHLPPTVTATTPIVFVMHGQGRDAERYRRDWASLADANGFVLVTPQFDRKTFPASRDYNYGGFEDAAGKLRPRDQWTFSAIEPMFDEVRRRTASRVAKYEIYGHSAGAQFVHRYILLMPNPRISSAVSANAGSYAMPVFDVTYPFGLRGAPVDEAQLKRALAMPLVVLLGTADIDPNHPALPKQPEAMAQGPFRLARGKAFYESAKAVAERLHAPFNWQLRFAEGIAHSDGGMAAFAAPFLGEAGGKK